MLYVFCVGIVSGVFFGLALASYLAQRRSRGHW